MLCTVKSLKNGEFALCDVLDFLCCVVGVTTSEVNQEVSLVD
jgi:hypothetical protein